MGVIWQREVRRNPEKMYLVAITQCEYEKNLTYVTRFSRNMCDEFNIERTLIAFLIAVCGVILCFAPIWAANASDLSTPFSDNQAAFYSALVLNILGIIVIFYAGVLAFAFKIQDHWPDVIAFIGLIILLAGAILSFSYIIPFLWQQVV